MQIVEQVLPRAGRGQSHLKGAQYPVYCFGNRRDTIYFQYFPRGNAEATGAASGLLSGLCHACYIHHLNLLICIGEQLPRGHSFPLPFRPLFGPSLSFSPSPIFFCAGCSTLSFRSGQAGRPKHAVYNTATKNVLKSACSGAAFHRSSICIIHFLTTLDSSSRSWVRFLALPACFATCSAVLSVASASRNFHAA